MYFHTVIYAGKLSQLWGNLVDGKSNGIPDPTGKTAHAEAAQIFKSYLKK